MPRSSRSSRTRRAFLAIAVAMLVVPVTVTPVAAAGYSLGLSAQFAAIGDTFTITPVVTSAPAGEPVRCQMSIEHGNAEDWVRMQVASNGCEPWTFTIPDGPTGQFLVSGIAWIGITSNGLPVSTVFAGNQAIDIGSGTPAPFVTNYPVQSWDLADLVSTSTPSYGAPLSIFPPATAEGCEMRILGGMEQAYTRQASSCQAWTFSIPDWDPHAPASMFLQTADVQVESWTGTSAYLNQDPAYRLVGAKFGETYAVSLPSFAPGDPPSTEYTSNLPAIFAGPMRYVTSLVGGPAISLPPVVVGLAEGWCLYDVGQASTLTAVVAGGCEVPVSIPSWPGPGNATSGAHLTLTDKDGHLLAKADTEVGWVPTMPDPVVEAPASVDAGTSVSIDASTVAGVPAGYEITAEPAPAGSPAGEPSREAATTTTSATVIASGVFDPSLGTVGDGITIGHAFATPGRYLITATFTDVRGVTRSGSTVIDVTGTVDSVGPTGTISVKGGAAWSTSANVTVSVPATDNSGMVAQVALSNDGTTWTTRAYSASQAWTLSAGNGAKTVRVKWKDPTGNWSAVSSDGISLDTVAPTASAPTYAFVSGAGVSSTSTPTKFSWTGADATSGVARYEAAISTDGGAYSSISTTLLSATLNRSLASGHTYRMRVRAVDRAGLAGAYVYGATFTVSSYQETSSRIAYSGTWYRPASTSYWGGYARYAKTAGAKASFTFTGRAYALIGCLGPTRGSFKVYVNGVLIKTVSTYSATTSCKRVLVALSWSTAVSRKVTIVVSGTTGHPRVDVDSIVAAY